MAAADNQPLLDEAGRPISANEFMQKVEAVWARQPATNQVGVDPLQTQVAEDEGSVRAVIRWQNGAQQKEVTSSFRLQPSAHFGWDVVQTTLLDDLLSVLS